MHENQRVIMFWQVVLVIAVALGAGLFAFGGYLEPRPDLAAAMGMMPVERGHSTELHVISSGARGAGIGLMTLGGLGLVVLWVNLATSCFARRQNVATDRDATADRGP
jgi:hypothetical protein